MINSSGVKRKRDCNNCEKLNKDPKRNELELFSIIAASECSIAVEPEFNLQEILHFITSAFNNNDVINLK